MDRSRLEAFSDGVFAVAITLLALDLTVEGPGRGRLLDQLYDKWPAFLAYLISFFMIGIVYYILENTPTPASPATPGGDETVA